ncbi:MAG: hypothetical protein QM796_20110 [Chthoniobacteraceae bacterium]
MNPAPSSHPPGTRFQFVVSSAEEAVQLIHDKFNGNARVVSVKQMTGNGLTRLLSAPKLEIIAEVTAPDAAAAPAATPPAPPVSHPVFPAAPAPEAAFPTFPTPPEPPVSPVSPAPTTPVPASVSFTSNAPANPNQPEIVDLPREADQLFSEPLERLLTRSGISPRLLARLQATDRWERIKRRPLRDSLGEVVELLRGLWNKQPQRTVGRHVAFFGTPGSGITTALCKALTMDIFFRQQPACVMKLDGDLPNPTEGLAMFCEALNVPLHRYGDNLAAIPEDQRVYFDLAGIPLTDDAQWRDLGRLLGEFYVETRVLILNAAYEMETIKRTFGLALGAGATHVVFTHLDEVQHWGKLWDCILSSGLTPLFLSAGQNVSGNVHEQVFTTLVEKTFRLPAAMGR